MNDEYVSDADYSGTYTVNGVGSIATFRFGGSPAPGLIIAGGIEGISGTFDTKDEWDTGYSEGEIDGVGNTVFVSVQKYFGNFFLRGDVGGFWGGNEDSDEADYGGFMLGAALGADFLVSKVWSLGFAVGSRYTLDSYDEDGYTGDATVLIPSLQMNATYY